MSPTTTVKLSEVLAGLSAALDLAEGQRQGHAVRSCLIGMRIADVIGLDEAQRSSLFYALLMKDLGSSSNAARFASLFGADDQNLKSAIKTINWTRAIESYRFVTRNVAPGAFWMTRLWRALAVATAGQKGAQEVVRTRCERGADIARLLQVTDETVQGIRSIDEHWDGQGQPDKLSGQAIPLIGRIVCLAQTVEVFATTYNVETALDVAAARRGSWFDPALVSALWTQRSNRRFWRGLAQDDILAQVACYEPAARILTADEDRLDRIADGFARVIDAKSPWTFRHSHGVATIAVKLGDAMGMGAVEVRSLRRAALLHDLGKLGVSNLILDKPGRLSEDEWVAMRRHPGFTYEILERVGCLRELAPVAASHHERLDAQGYHRGLEARSLTKASRILTAADICDALRSSRPYRPGLPAERVLAVMRKEVGSVIDPDCFSALENLLRTVPDPTGSGTPAVATVPALSDDYGQAA